MRRKAFYCCFTMGAFTSHVLPLLMLIALLATAPGFCEIHFISPSGEKPCHYYHHCHNLSYYLPLPINYFTSNTDLFFIEGDHQLIRHTAVQIKGDGGSLTLKGLGRWVPGSDELVMESTVIIHCNKTGGGLKFLGFSSVNIQGLTFMGCGAYFPDVFLDTSFKNELFYVGILFLHIDKLTILNVSAQESIGYGLATIDCIQINVFQSSFTYSNIHRISSRQVNISGGNAGFFFQSSANERYNLKVSQTNFSKGCASLTGGGGVLVMTFAGIGNETGVHVKLEHAVISQNVATLIGAGVCLRLYGGKVHVSIENTVIKDGISLKEKGANTVIKDGISSKRNRDGGAGVYAYIGDYTSLKISLKLQDVLLKNNIGSHGGDFALLCHSPHAMQNKQLNIIMQNTVIEHQNAQKRIGNSAVILILATCQFKFVARKLTMTLGSAYSFGIVARSGGSSKTLRNIFLEECNFHGNHNMQSLLVFSSRGKQIERAHTAIIINSTFQNNSGISVITARSLKRLQITNILVTDNNMTAIMLDHSALVSEGYNVIQRNTNVKGAGLHLTSDSVVEISNGSTFAFINNTAKEMGGAILVQENMAQQIFTPPCTILPQQNQTVTSQKPVIAFSGNRALIGSDLYGANLIQCVYKDGNQRTVVKPALSSPNKTLQYFDFTNLKRLVDFKFENTDQLSSISSDPILVCFCDGKGIKPDCSNRSQLQTSIYPGEPTIVTIVLVGYYGGTSMGTLQITPYNVKLASPHSLQLATPKCSNLKLMLQSSKVPSFGKVDIDVLGGLPDWQLSIIVRIKNCPPGFEIDHNSGECKCAQLLQKYNISCNITLQSARFHKCSNNWIAYLNNSHLHAFNISHCLTAFDNCPFDYCNTSSISFDIQNLEDQCASNRTGVLCGECKDGLSLMLGSNHCASCSNTYLLLLLAFVLAGVVLVAALMALNLTVSVGTVNGLLFYAHMVKLNEAFFFRNIRIPFLSQFISWLNLDLGIEVCFFDGLDGYWKTWLQFAFPGYLFVLMAAIIFGCHYSVRLSRLCGSHAVPALATLFLMSYTKTLQTITKALSMSQLVCDNGTVLRVWTVDGNIAYFSEKHIPLLIFSCCVLLVGVVYPVLVLSAPLLERFGDKCLPTRCNPVARLKPLLDAYGGPYKDTYRYWTGVTLLVRLIVAVVFSFTSGDLIPLNCHIITSVVMGIFFTLALTKGVYKSTYKSILEMLFLVNLFLFTVVSLAAFHLNSFRYQGIAAVVSISFSVVLSCAICAVHAWWHCKKFKWYASLTNTVLFYCSKQHTHSPTVESPSSLVYGTIREPKQFDLVFDSSRLNSELANPISCDSDLREREPLLFDS